MATRNNIVDLISRGEPAFGGNIHVGDTMGARKMGDSTFDFVMLDMEHEGFDMPKLGESLQWLISRKQITGSGSPFAGPTPIVRLPHTASHATTWIAAQALDYGALGIVLPYTETAAEVELMVRAMRYPRVDGGELVGERRVWPKMAMRYWGCSSFDEYVEMADLWPVAPRGEVVLDRDGRDTASAREHR